MNGPWDNEPDELDFVCCGLQCRIVRHLIFGHLCGYVRVPDKHELQASDYNEIRVDVHGGLTYGGCPDGYQGYWLGFDYHHFPDLAPHCKWDMESLEQGDYLVYRDMAYVRDQCCKLAQQIVIKTYRTCREVYGDEETDEQRPDENAN
jgi:hypothetical protein